MTIGSEIKLLRGDYGLTQAQLAKVLGVTAQSVYYWERDEFQPAPHHLQDLAQMWNARFDPRHKGQIERWLNERLAIPDAATPPKVAAGGSALIAAAAAIGLGLLLGAALAESDKPKRRTSKKKKSR
jgi:transcriptional regulator with XRE-family HTH domain